MSVRIEIAKSFIRLVETFELDELTAAPILHPDYIQWELPNLLVPRGQKSDLRDSFRRVLVGKTILERQSYEISSSLEHDDTVVIEAQWSGKMAISAGPLKMGQEMKAHFCMIFSFKDGKIHRVRNYDCFEAFG